MASIAQQILVVFQKNYMVYFQEKQFIGEFAVPIIVFAMLMVAQKENNPVFLEVVAEFVPMTFLATSRYIVIQMIAEKSERQKEIQKIMGLKGSAYQLGWLLFNFSRLISVCFIFLLLTVPSNCFAHPKLGQTYLDSGQIIGSFILFGLSQCSQSYFITALFDQPRSGADMSVIVTIIGSFCAQLLNVGNVNSNGGLLILLGFCFPTFGFDIFVFPQLGGIVNQDWGISIEGYFVLQASTALIYAFLYYYLEQVLPNEYGTNKHPLFFFGFKYQTETDVLSSSYELGGMGKPFISNRQSEFQEDASSAIYHEVFENIKQKAIQIKNVRKSYGELKAVDGVTLQIYDSQILCLLGHNGAGKTTLISLLTGLIKRDSGLISYYNTDTDFEDIRSYLGICPQRDVLYDSMTCDQHLWYYGKIKGIEDKQLYLDIDLIINKCDLLNDRAKLAKNLSGGTKRKLSLAISLIGQSKVVFLDEPTSGMDPISRKKIWDILLQVKSEGRCLVLTTHHLDEAEVLSERIAIMAKGRLLTVGSVDFVKVNFGIGYHLNIYNKGSSDWEKKSKNILALTKKCVPSSRENPQTPQECLSFSINFDKKEELLPLFQQLEKDPQIELNLIMNTLEEAFINIGMDEETFLQKKVQGLQATQDTTQVNLNEELNKIVPPSCLSRPPIFNFGLQLWSCLLKKHYNVTTKRLIIGIIMPAVFIILGPLLSTVYYKSFVNKNAEQYENEFYENALAVFDSYGYIILGIAIASSQVGSQPVEEREKKQKYALNVMGCRILPFWLGYYIYDLLISIILLVIFIITVVACGYTELNNGVFYTLVFFNFFAYLPFSYMLSWMFNSFNSAVKSLLIIQVIGFYLIAIIIYLVSFKNEAGLWILTFVCPSLSFFSGCVTFLNGLKLIGANGKVQHVSAFGDDIRPYVFIIILFFQGLAYFGITLLLDNRQLLAANNSGQLGTISDQDVLTEEQRVLDQRCQDRILARKISKTYANGFQAVKGTSFGVEPGTIFGLLGPNGAGKSTTFNMITSRLKPSSGNIYLEQVEIKKGLGEVYQNVGICPQFDSLYDIVSVRRHLQLWAYLKGLKGQELEESILYFLKVMQLENYENSLAGQLSGGNKRKLCVALALMGGTNMQFFDEPSSGVDPIARRFLWNAIQQGVKLRQSSVILTTHTMDEAESLCNKIAIQVNGAFACIGSVQHLKQKFGEGYRIVIDPINQESVSQIQQQLSQNFGKIDFNLDEHTGKIICKFPIQGFQFYQTFYTFQQVLLNELKLIKDFQISQPNLEQIFVQFAAQQVAEQEKVQIQKNCCSIPILCGNDEDN
ncbi:unnamed protein product (macronuclear) [Paramecium tetraurelia]|uniref:ABC transporter domain-containing protein n=1 Tax=Paramecium tetraurelia TaxID=5888 RepID=A0D0Z1_PARTE|nr:uncharacterized protein GSPATT00012260001 [Paramecium tetraurelia]CAK76708.1 unnamed protein product [Paramecium tetraurelia]|eukprot:XP_001444105.1 hypothetical protein (macronuclear) [Paramecium tetraurelia strain d4-2]